MLTIHDPMNPIRDKPITSVEQRESSDQMDEMNLVQELIALIESTQSIGDFRKTQRKEASSLVRRLKLLMPLLEEIRDIGPPIPEAAMICLGNLKKSFVAAKKLLVMCHEGSKIYLALDGEGVMVRFHSVYEKLMHALAGMPYGEIGISEEVKEQVELMRMQFRRAKLRTDTQDMELTMDVMVALSTNDDRNAESSSIERLANRLSLHTVEDLRAETMAVKKLIKERGQNAEGNQQIINLLGKFKRILGIEDWGVVEDPVETKVISKPSISKSSSPAIPNEFLCPITLEIMTDPVIIATGQTYERESIQKWLDSDHRTCPKTGQVLAHLSLASNFALKNLISQWSEENKIPLPKKDAMSSSETSSLAPNDEISSLIQDLNSSHLEVQRKAVRKIRMLTKESVDSRILVAKGGGIPPLVHLLAYPDSKIQEHAVTALLNLSIDESNKKIISSENPIPSIIEILQNGTIYAKENSAAALFSLSMLDENKATIGSSNGIPPLVELLKTGTIRGKKDAVTALFSLTLCQANKVLAIEAGIVGPVLKLLKDNNLEMVDEALSLLLVLVSILEGRREIGELPVIETLVGFIRNGTPKNKECAAALLFELCLNNKNTMLAALQFGSYDDVVELSKSGTSRGKRKANSLLEVMTKCCMS